MLLSSSSTHSFRSRLTSDAYTPEVFSNHRNLPRPKIVLDYGAFSTNSSTSPSIYLSVTSVEPNAMYSSRKPLRQPLLRFRTRLPNSLSVHAIEYNSSTISTRWYGFIS